MRSHVFTTFERNAILAESGPSFELRNYFSSRNLLCSIDGQILCLQTLTELNSLPDGHQSPEKRKRHCGISRVAARPPFGPPFWMAACSAILRAGPIQNL